MLKRQDLTSAEQTAAVIDAVVIYRLEHIHIDFRKVYIPEQLYPFVCLVKERQDIYFKSEIHLRIAKAHRQFALGQQRNDLSARIPRTSPQFLRWFCWKARR